MRFIGISKWFQYYSHLIYLGQHILFEKMDRVFVSALTLICVIQVVSLFPRSRKSQASKPRCIRETEVARCLSVNKSMCLVLLALGQK